MITNVSVCDLHNLENSIVESKLSAASKQHKQ